MKQVKKLSSMTLLTLFPIPFYFLLKYSDKHMLELGRLENSPMLICIAFFFMGVLAAAAIHCSEINRCNLHLVTMSAAYILVLAVTCIIGSLNIWTNSIIMTVAYHTQEFFLVIGVYVCAVLSYFFTGKQLLRDNSAVIGRLIFIIIAPGLLNLSFYLVFCSQSWKDAAEWPFYISYLFTAFILSSVVSAKANIKPLIILIVLLFWAVAAPIIAHELRSYYTVQILNIIQLRYHYIILGVYLYTTVCSFHSHNLRIHRPASS